MKMLALIHIDWGGTPEQLKAFDKAYEKAAEKTEGVKFVGRMVPWSQKFHFTMVLKMDIEDPGASEKDACHLRAYPGVRYKNA